MNEEQSKSLRQQAGDTVVDFRNELIVQTTNAFLLGRQIVLTGVGLTFLGVDQVKALLQQAVERGEVAECDVETYVATQRRKMADGATSAFSSRLASLLNHVPGVSIAYTTPARGETEISVAVEIPKAEDAQR